MNAPFRIEEVKFLNEIKAIITEHYWMLPPKITNIELSNSDEDTKESFDLTYKSKVDISVRIRDNKMLTYCDFTIRCRSLYGNKTEIDKLKEGKGSVYLYAWKSIDNTRLEAWILVDINKFRSVLTEYETKEIPNADGTKFKAYPIKLLHKHDAVIQCYNLPEWIVF